MTTYLWHRLLAAIPVILGVSVLVFSSLYLLPGDPIQALVSDVPMEKARVEELRQQLGLNDPPWEQYGRFIGGALRGDLGRSLQTGRPVMEEILMNLPPTLDLTAAAMIIAIVLGITLGTLAAIRPHSPLDNVTMLVAMTGVAMPSFWLGLLLLLLFSLALQWLPPTGTGGIERLVMPAFTLGYGAAAIIARLTRGAMLDVLAQDYIVTARSKGLAEFKVIFRHGLKNALIPVLTVIGIQAGNLLSGAVIVETIFSRQGIGRMLIHGILGRDFPLVQGTILFVATVYVLLNIFIDILYAWIDPRIRYR